MLLKLPNNKLDEDTFGGPRVVSCVQTDGQKDGRSEFNTCSAKMGTCLKTGETWNRKQKLSFEFKFGLRGYHGYVTE
jgi:hypothetical protein